MHNTLAGPLSNKPLGLIIIITTLPRRGISNPPLPTLLKKVDYSSKQLFSEATVDK